MFCPAGFKFTDTESPCQACAAGKYHSMVLTATGNLYSFGACDNGILGHGMVECDRSMPLQISGISNVKMIKCGDNHNLAIVENI